MFRRLPDPAAAEVTVLVNGAPVRVAQGTSAAAALLLAGGAARATPVSAAPRAPYCMMGVCFDCLMEIDGVPNQQACLVTVREGMRINHQSGVPRVAP